MKNCSKPILIAGVVAQGLSGCVTASSSTPPLEDPRPTYAERTAIAADRISDMESLFRNEGQTLFLELPSAGQSDYTGLLGLLVERPNEDSVELIGDMTVVANWSSRTVSGDVTNFQADTDVYVPGELSMTSGRFENRNDLAHIDLQFSGSVDVEGDTFAYEAKGDADITGRGLDYFAGQAEGDLTQNGAVVGEGIIDFALERGN